MKSTEDSESMWNNRENTKILKISINQLNALKAGDAENLELHK